MSYSKYFAHPFDHPESLPAAGIHGKITSFKICLRQILKEVIFPTMII